MAAGKALGNIIQGTAANSAGEYNADIEDYNAIQAENDGRINLDMQEREAAKVIGQARATMGASGIQTTEGSSLDILKQSAVNAARDSTNMRNRTASKAYGFRMSADMQREKGKTALYSSMFSAAGTLLEADMETPEYTSAPAPARKNTRN